MAMFTNRSRFTGMSGVDVESMVTTMMKAQSVKYNKLKTSKQSLVWKQSAYQGVTKNIKTFQTSYLDVLGSTVNMRSPSAYGGFKSSSRYLGSDTTIVTATAGADAKAGTYQVEVTNIATQSKIEANSVFTSPSLTGKGFDYTKLNPLGGDSFKISLDGGPAKEIDLDNSIVTALQSGTVADKTFLESAAGLQGALDTKFGGGKVTVNFDTVTKALTFTPGSGHTLSLSSAEDHAMIESNSLTTPAAISAVGGSLNITDKNGVVKTINITSGATTLEGIASKMNQALKTAGLNKKLTAVVDGTRVQLRAEDKSDKYDVSGGLLTSLNGNATETLATDLTLMGFENNASSKLNPNLKISDLFAFTADGSITVNSKQIAFKLTDTVESFMKKIDQSGAGVKLEYNELTSKFAFFSTDTGVASQINISTADLDNMFGIGNHTATVGADAIVDINGTTLTRASNSFEVYGINFNINDVTTGGNKVNVVISRDVETGFENIKAFVDSYNTLWDDLNSEYKTRTKSIGKYEKYTPLSEDEKANMTDREIELWEAEARKGLLYNDPILRDIMSSLRSMTYEPVTLSDGSKLSIYQIGITTTGDGGKLQIDVEKLRKALSERPDDVAELFTKTSDSSLKDKYGAKLKDEGIAERWNDILNRAVSAKNGTLTEKAGLEGISMTSAMKKQIDKMDEDLEKMLKALQKKEDSYYRQFAAMENAMMQANSQLESLFAGLNNMNGNAKK